MICQNNGARALFPDGRKTDMRERRLKRGRGEDGGYVRESEGVCRTKRL